MFVVWYTDPARDVPLPGGHLLSEEQRGAPPFRIHQGHQEYIGTCTIVLHRS